MTEALDAITTLLERYRACIGARDPLGLAGLYHDDVRIFDVWDVWAHEGAASWRTFIERWLESLGDRHVRVEFDQLLVHADAKLATATCVATYVEHAATGKALHSMQNRFTWILVREGVSWRVVHEHTSVPIREADFSPVLRAADA
jgi:ketosteroid isomerase-like protein